MDWPLAAVMELLLWNLGGMSRISRVSMRRGCGMIRSMVLLLPYTSTTDPNPTAFDLIAETFEQQYNDGVRYTCTRIA